MGTNILHIVVNVPEIQNLLEHRVYVNTNNNVRYDIAVDTNDDGIGGYHIHVKRHGEHDDLFSMKQDGSMHDEHLIVNSGFKISKTFIKTMSEIPELKKFHFNWAGIPAKYLM